jgi:hypothetical protein
MKILLLGAIFTISVLIVATAALRSTKIPSPQLVQTSDVVNETEAFEVESLTSQIIQPGTGEVRYVLKLKNVSAKKITAYSIKHPSGVRTSTDFVVTGGGIAPGGVETVDISDAPQPTTSAQSNKITVELAVFEDGSSEGDFDRRKFIMGIRLGARMGFEQIDKILQEALRSKQGGVRESDAIEKEWLEQIISDVTALSDQSLPGEVNVGFHRAKEMTLNNLKTLREWKNTIKSDPIKAESLLHARGQGISGTHDLLDGTTKIIRFNENHIKRYKEGLNEK